MALASELCCILCAWMKASPHNIQTKDQFPGGNTTQAVHEFAGRLEQIDEYPKQMHEEIKCNHKTQHTVMVSEHRQKNEMFGNMGPHSGPGLTNSDSIHVRTRIC
jgi:hypothetical protein